ncbi:glycosyl transferase, family 2 [Candidatus Scalindua japonica]|uniref:Glycosyl transferase, family 2 n=1 Tax=Candidatus Scalindua japonica TaxID=1284222 RepID=A0A286TWV4_9BACT|nr:glycosyltransferase family 2 protein [Candidatus Scalindua japonica]GAX60369.1 glycosyl transferase, family 2 [Candidatus Scalindua japonica]
MIDIEVKEQFQKKIKKNGLKQLHRKLNREPDSYEINLQLGIFYFQKSEISKAIFYLEKAADLNKDHAELQFILANAHKVLNNASKSEVFFKKALALQPENFEFLYNYGLLLHSSNRLSEATEIFEMAIKTQPDNYKLLNDIGVLFHLQHKYCKAIHFFEEAIKIKPDYIVAVVNTGYVYLAVNDLSKAQKVVNKLYINHRKNSEVINLKKKFEFAITKSENVNLDLNTELYFSDQPFQISPLKIIKDFEDKANLQNIGLSVVIPICNERENIPLLYTELLDTLNNLKQAYEIIFVDDGSIDGSGNELEKIAERDKDVKVIYLRRNYGQTAALNAGFKYSRGAVVITLDGDLQNDPADIPILLEKMAEGYDLVSGLREKRKDKMLTRRIPSFIANRLINKLIKGTGVQLRDFGCTLKAYKRGIIKNINLYGEMHRFIPVFAAWLGVKVAEVPVNHRPRINGVPKYNLSRVSRVIFDLIVIRFFSDYLTTPIQFFGKIAAKIAGMGLIVVLVLSCLALFTTLSVSFNTIILLSGILLLTVLQIAFMGLLGEIIMRSYFEGQNKDYYVVKNITNDVTETSQRTLGL